MATTRVCVVHLSKPSVRAHLRCTFGTPVEDMIRHSPPFPLVLDYGPHILKKWTAEDELGLLLASQHLPRVSEIVLSAPGSTLANLTTAMTEAAPRLETLSLHSQTSEIVLPKRFLEGGGAPQLRHLILTGAALSPSQPLLASAAATSLVSLVLERVTSSAYFSPDSLVTQIRAMPFLQVLSISFLSTVPRPGFRGERVLPRGQVARIELPGLTQLIYRGVSAYIEALLSRIRSPRIEDVDIALFNQLTLDVPRTCEFVRELESLRPTRARIDFAEGSVHITVSAPHSTASSSPDVFLSVSCARLDFQVAATAQLCSGLSATLLSVEELVLGFHRGGALAEEWRGEVDPGLWRGFLAPFGSVGTLRVHVALAVDVERALRPDPTAQPLLPELREIVLLHGSDENTLESASAVFSTFVDERDGAGHPVKVHSQDLSRLVESETVRAVSSRRILGIV
ncbi:hypothetical protein EDB85DRAFT_2154013 [Lactarius pseudohatsudake]|nr:hypothetical protein EDB85DRAFT_2154013 [Lactarius pseudohatsudake]